MYVQRQGKAVIEISCQDVILERDKKHHLYLFIARGSNRFYPNTYSDSDSVAACGCVWM